jgi:hypothetical protein
MHKQVLDEICEDCTKEYCTLKELLLHDAKYNDRMVLQIKCVEKWKYEESVRQRKEVTWQDAWELWMDRGYAKKFSEVYKEDIHFKELYKLVIG